MLHDIPPRHSELALPVFFAPNLCTHTFGSLKTKTYKYICMYALNIVFYYYMCNDPCLFKLSWMSQSLSPWCYRNPFRQHLLQADYLPDVKHSLRADQEQKAF